MNCMVSPWNEESRTINMLDQYTDTAQNSKAIDIGKEQNDLEESWFSSWVLMMWKNIYKYQK